MPYDTVMTRREDSLDEPIYAQYRFSQTVPSGQGIAPHIRLLSVSEDILATVHGDRDVLIWKVKRNLPPQRIEIEIVLDFITGIAISPASSNIVALSFRLGPKCEVWTFNWADQVAEAMFTTGLDLHSAQFSPDGRLLAWISAGHQRAAGFQVRIFVGFESNRNGIPVGKADQLGCRNMVVYRRIEGSAGDGRRRVELRLRCDGAVGRGKAANSRHEQRHVLRPVDSGHSETRQDTFGDDGWHGDEWKNYGDTNYQRKDDDMAIGGHGIGLEAHDGANATRDRARCLGCG
ncbi:hypothetical protein CSAL01_00992 [Colletotrichum salicis]|uniref:Uncharacterized protein n=1 Tax=Colletotrichum salicis TaxID=1209931 RepID=A0A135UNL6_9PEZI|nr:hypothetical protein CSAL01_00992 [Colletotrichum salicis]